MSHSITSSLQKRLVEQLVFIDENRYNFLDTYFSANTLERGKVDKFFETYAQEVEKFLSAFPQQITSVLPRVFIGSKVSLLYEQEQEIDVFTICFPEMADPDLGRISFLAPIGWQLLLRSVNEPFSLETPSGKVDVVITEIKFEDW